MITYNAKKATFDSKFNSYDVLSIDPALVYEWVCTKQISLALFKVWIDTVKENAFADGEEFASIKDFN